MYGDEYLKSGGGKLTPDEIIGKEKEKINILDANHKYLNENELVYELNNHNIHICCSLYEAWGHYLWEAMSCGKLVICSEIPVFKEYLDPNLVKFIPIKAIYTSVINYEYLSNPLYKLRKGYFVDKSKFEDTLNNKEYLFEFQKNNCDNIRHHFLENCKNHFYIQLEFSTFMMTNKYICICQIM